MTDIRRFLVTGFGLGWLPLAPGSWGSLPPVIIFALLHHSNIPVTFIAAVLVILATAASIICVKFTPVSMSATGKNDPGEVVADEIAGQSIALLFACAVIDNPLWITAGGSYFFYRLLDTTKPWPIHRLEKLPAGWGVLLDDLAAGVYGGVTFLIALYLWKLRNGG
jgi:phosphatidylglycerophosphatase A